MMGECPAGSSILWGIRVVHLRHSMLYNSASNYFPRGGQQAVPAPGMVPTLFPPRNVACPLFFFRAKRIKEAKYAAHG